MNIKSLISIHDPVKKIKKNAAFWFLLCISTYLNIESKLPAKFFLDSAEFL